MLANITAIYINGNKKRGSPPVKPDDFILKSFWKTETEQDVDTIKKALGIK